MGRVSTIIWRALSKALWIIVFLFIILILNIVVKFFSDPLYIQVIGFLNQNVWLLIVVALLFFLGDVFALLDFPFNLPSPLFEGFGAVGVTMFLLRIVKTVVTTAGVSLAQVSWLDPFIYGLVFLAVIIPGYFWIVSRFVRSKKYKSDHRD